MFNQRLQSIDVLRGGAIILVIFFHAAVYNYANINKIDFSDPPIVVVAISFLMLWGGLLIFLSGVVNAYMLSKRLNENYIFKPVKYLFVAGFIYFFLHYVLNFFLGRWNNDFVNNKPDMTVVASSLRNMHLIFPTVNKFFEGSSFSTIALNIIIVSILLFVLFKSKNEKKNYFVLGLIGFLIMIFSFVRVYLYGFLIQAIVIKNYFLAIILSFTIANPYPLLPYLSYGIFASMVGLMIYKNQRNLLKKAMIPLGIFFFVFGLIGASNFEKTISTPDFFWYFKTNMELGIFIITTVLFYLLFEKSVLNKLAVIKWFGRVSLTIYMLETLLSELLRILMNNINTYWNQTINNCLLFGLLNVFVWMVILFFWKKNGFKYSLEYFWVKFFDKIGKKSTKMEELR